jgi:hypothetical protein
MTSKQSAAARKNIKKAAAAARRKRTIAHLPSLCAPHSARKVPRPQSANAPSPPADSRNDVVFFYAPNNSPCRGVFRGRLRSANTVRRPSDAEIACSCATAFAKSDVG